jgi:hypothetical protein
VKKKRTKFQYQKRSPETWKRKAAEGSGNFDRYVEEGIDRFAARDGVNRIRVLPPTWPNSDDWAYRMLVHFGVGPDEQSYLCKSMLNEPCVICEEVTRLARDGDVEDARKLKAKKRYGCWVIDRKDPGSGPRFWAMPYTVWHAANLAAQDEDGAVHDFDDPENGYDILLNKEGTRDRTQYLGVKLARTSTPLSADEDEADTWLEYAVENSIPDLLKFYDNDHIAAVFGAKAVVVDEDEVKPRRRRVVEDDDEDEVAPRKRAVTVDDDDEDEEEVKPRRAKLVAVEDDDDDEDEEQKKPVRRRVAKPVDDDEDEAPFDDDEDEDEDEEKPRRRSRVTAVLERTQRTL